MCARRFWSSISLRCSGRSASMTNGCGLTHRASARRKPPRRVASVIPRPTRLRESNPARPWVRRGRSSSGRSPPPNAPTRSALRSRRCPGTFGARRPGPWGPPATGARGARRGGGVSGDQAQPRGQPRRCRCRDRFHTGNTVGHALRRQRALLGGDVFGRLGCGGQGRPLRCRGKASPGRFGSRSVDFSIGLPLRRER